LGAGIPASRLYGKLALRRVSAATAVANGHVWRRRSLSVLEGLFAGRAHGARAPAVIDATSTTSCRFGIMRVSWHAAQARFSSYEDPQFHGACSASSDEALARARRLGAISSAGKRGPTGGARRHARLGRLVRGSLCHDDPAILIGCAKGHSTMAEGWGKWYRYVDYFRCGVCCRIRVELRRSPRAVLHRAVGTRPDVHAAYFWSSGGASTVRDQNAASGPWAISAGPGRPWCRAP